MPLGACHRRVDQRDAPAHHIDHRLAATFVGHMLESCAGALREHLAGNVRCAADAGGAVGQRLGLGQRDHVLQRLDRQVGMGHQDQRRGADLAHGREVLERVEGHFGEDMRVDDHRAVESQQQRVTVGRRGGSLRRADVARGPWLVVDNDLLPQATAQRVGNQPAAGIGDPAWRERHHQADRPTRVVLRLRERRLERRDGQSQQGQAGELECHHRSPVIVIRDQPSAVRNRALRRNPSAGSCRRSASAAAAGRRSSLAPSAQRKPLASLARRRARR